MKTTRGRNIVAALIIFAMNAVLAPMAGAQEVLPFPPTPSGSTAGLTMQDSIHKKRVTPSRLRPERRMFSSS
jgi:arylsulfatase